MPPNAGTVQNLRSGALNAARRASLEGSRRPLSLPQKEGLLDRAAKVMRGLFPKQEIPTISNIQAATEEAKRQVEGLKKLGFIPKGGRRTRKQRRRRMTRRRR